MTYLVQFHDVSKRYQLGMTRTSLPALINQFARNMIRPSKEDNITKSKYQWAVHGVSFDLEAGESLGLVGPNGAGKTTILKLLTMITIPTSGEIKVNGKLSALIELGAGFHPDLSGRENIYLNGTILGLKRSEIRNLFDEIVAFSELEKFIDTPLKRYSSGMAVRLGFAVASSVHPDILLVDEVLAVGDTSFRMKCIQRIKNLIKNGTSLIFVSHNTSLVKAVCKKSLYIDNGQAIYYGDTDEAIARYNQALDERRKVGVQKDELLVSRYDTHLELTSISVINLDNPSTNIVKTTDSIKVVMDYLAYEDVGETKEINIVLRIIRSDGTSCVVIYSDQEGCHLQVSKRGGQITVVFEPIQLFPGSYQIVASAKNPDNTVTYSMIRSVWFKILGESKSYDDLDAVFEPNRTWNHQQLD